MKTRTFAGIAVLLAIVCVGQQVWIFRDHRAEPTQAVADLIPPATCDIEVLSRSLQRPAGARSVGVRETHRLHGASQGTTGLEAALWIDTSDIEFAGRAKDFREERVAEVTAFYAKQIAAMIPSAVIECAIDRPGMAESGSLHSTFLLRHPVGCVVVSGGFTSAAGSEPRISDVMKIQVISTNYRGNARRELVVDKTLPPGNS